MPTGEVIQCREHRRIENRGGETPKLQVNNLGEESATLAVTDITIRRPASTHVTYLLCPFFLSCILFTSIFYLVLICCVFGIQHIGGVREDPSAKCSGME